MKKLILDFVTKYKKVVRIAAIGLSFIILGLLSWNLVFVKYKDFAVNESKFIKAVKRYYEYHSQFLPNDNESREITLQDLYDNNQIKDLYVPKTRKMCDVNSWVRVYKENDEYKYYAYLKCGKYASHVDHEGPTIILNGDDEVIIPLNSEYKDEGVKKVIDKKDGKISTDKVVIDTSKVDTSKIGTYKVTYLQNSGYSTNHKYEKDTNCKSDIAILYRRKESENLDMFRCFFREVNTIIDAW